MVEITVNKIKIVICLGQLHHLSLIGIFWFTLLDLIWQLISLNLFFYLRKHFFLYLNTFSSICSTFSETHIWIVLEISFPSTWTLHLVFFFSLSTFSQLDCMDLIYLYIQSWIEKPFTGFWGDPSYRNNFATTKWERDPRYSSLAGLADAAQRRVPEWYADPYFIKSSIKPIRGAAG